MILVKLGGSVITNKQKVLSARRKAIGALACALKKIREPVAVVHGGGSYGHYWSTKYDMHTKPARYDTRGVSVVKNSMIVLHRIILDSMQKAGIDTYPAPPSSFMGGSEPIKDRIAELGRIAAAGMVPVTYGDALWHGGRRSYILSGDRIMTHLAAVLRPRLTIFALNVDGVYSDLKTKRLVGRIGGQRIRVSEVGMDVTGGMRRKIEEATNISNLGLKVFLTNGNRPERITGAVNRNRFEGTVFGARRAVGG